MWRALFAAVSLAFSIGCVSKATRPTPPEPLYFAVELTEGGKRIGAPKLIGFSGKRIIAERRAPGAAESDYRLVLEPREVGPGYQLGVKLQLPSGEQSGDVAMLHGEERSLPLGPKVELKVLMMRVDSDEFRAFISTPGPAARGQI